MKQIHNSKLAGKRATRRASGKAASSVPVKADSLVVRSLVIVILIVAIVLGAVLYRFAAVGKAVEAPQPQPVDLDLFESENINVETVSQVLLTITPSGESVPQTYSLQLKKENKTVVTYTLAKEGSSVVLLQELLTAKMTERTIYLPGDEIADLKISYATPYLKLLNVQYAPPDPVTIVVLGAAKNIINSRFLKVGVNTSVSFFWNATSSVPPMLSAAWLNGTPFPAEMFVLNASGSDFTTMQLKWPAAPEGAYVFTITATAGPSEITKKQYTMGVGGVVYAAFDLLSPDIILKQTSGDKVKVTLTFKPTLDLQPFSIPCGDATLGTEDVPPEEFPESKIAAVYSYTSENGVQQWKKDAPSDFSTLKPNIGYFLKRTDAIGDLSIVVECTVPDSGSDVLLPPEATVLFNQPSLVKGWNFIGISGYEPLLLSKLTGKTPPYTSIKKVFELNNKGVDSVTIVESLDPGKAYWVRVE